MNKKCCTPNTENCENPLVAIFKMAESIVTPLLSISAALNKVLNDGLITTHSGKMCCPDCTAKKGYYYLGGYAPYVDLATLFSQIKPEKPSPRHIKYPCCLNHSFSGTTLVGYDAVFDGYQPVCCDTRFSEYVSKLYSISDIATLLTTVNIIEASTFDGVSGLEILIDFLLLENLYTKAELGEIFQVILTNGIVVKCIDCDIIISSVQTFETISQAYNIL